MLDKIDFQIITALLKSNMIMTSEDLAFVTGKSSRTVRRRLKDINIFLKDYNAQTIMRPGIGIELVLEEGSDLRTYMKELNSQNNIENDLKELISILINEETSLDLAEISDLLFISRSKLSKLLGELERILIQYDLSLDSKNLKIDGSEINLRRFISSYYVQEIWFTDSLSEYGYIDHQSKDIKKIQDSVTEVLGDLSYSMSTQIQKSLVAHLYVAVGRIRREQSLIEDVYDVESSQREHLLAIALSKEMEALFNVVFQKSEIDYITMHLIGKRVLNEVDQLRISPKVNKLIDLILDEILLLKGIDLRNDFHLRMMLGLHVVPLISRIEYGIELKNPILDEVRVSCVAGFDLALICSKIINETYHTTLSEHEVSYFAMHFDVSLYKKREQGSKSNVLIVCSTGRASAQLLKMKFEQHFKDHLAFIEVCDLTEMENKLQEETYDFIFTTIPVETDLKIQVPIFEFSFFLDQSSINKIESILTSNVGGIDYETYFDESLFLGKHNFSNREEVLNHMITKIQEHENLPENFRELVWERENFSGTDILEHTALPHPAKLVSNRTFVSVLILEKPILWESRKVQVVFLISISKNDGVKYKDLLEKIVDIASSPIRIQNIIQGGTFTSLITEISKF